MSNDLPKRNRSEVTVATEQDNWRVSVSLGMEDSPFTRYVFARNSSGMECVLRPVVNPTTKKLTGFVPYRLSNDKHIPGMSQDDRVQSIILDPAVSTIMQNMAEPLKDEYQEAISKGKAREGIDYDTALTEKEIRRHEKMDLTELEAEAAKLASAHYARLSISAARVGERLFAAGMAGFYTNTVLAETTGFTDTVERGTGIAERIVNGHDPDTIVGDILGREVEQFLAHRDGVIATEARHGMTDILHELRTEGLAWDAKEIKKDSSGGKTSKRDSKGRG